MAKPARSRTVRPAAKKATAKPALKAAKTVRAAKSAVVAKSAKTAKTGKAAPAKSAKAKAVPLKAASSARPRTAHATVATAATPARGGQARSYTKAHAAVRPARVAVSPPVIPSSKAPVTPAPPLPPPGPSAREQAVEVFERAFHALQQRDFSRAASLLNRVVAEFQDEKELQERARVYLAICQRQASSNDGGPRSYHDRVGAATLAINRGEFDEALARLLELAHEDANDDHVLYMLAVVQTARGEVDEALSHFRLAVELNSDNQYLASQDDDLEALRQHDGFGAFIEELVARRRAAKRSGR
jgi:tetratricopeptide (TPR) repeat protein